MSKNKQFQFTVLGGVLGIILFILPLIAGDKQQQKHPEVENFEKISCVECHTEVTPDIVKDWKSSKHGKMNFACYMCHGDGIEEFNAVPATDRCISCHSGQIDFSNLKQNQCFDCHQGHTLKFHMSKDE
jgi:hypothetical protein